MLMPKVSLDKAQIQEKIGSHLYHYNSLFNSLRFLSEKSLLSRNFMIQKGIQLTPQLSDVIDLQHDILDTIFLEAKHSMNSYKRYGPICFVLKSEILENSNIFPTGRFLRNNPEDWTNDATAVDKYLTTTEDVSKSCLVVSNTSGFIPLSEYIEKILIAPSLQERSEAKGRKVFEEQNNWCKSTTGKEIADFDRVAMINIKDSLRENGVSADVEIDISDNALWKSKMTNWIEMMYFPGKLFAFDKEIDIVYNKRRYNFRRNEEFSSLKEELRILYRSCFSQFEK